MKKIWNECIDCECLFEAYVKTKTRCPVCNILNKQKRGGKYMKKHAKRINKLKRLKTKEKRGIILCKTCKKPIKKMRRRTFCSDKCFKNKP